MTRPRKLNEIRGLIGELRETMVQQWRKAILYWILALIVTLLACAVIYIGIRLLDFLVFPKGF